MNRLTTNDPHWVIGSALPDPAHQRETRELADDSIWGDLARCAAQLGSVYWSYVAAPSCYAEGRLEHALRVMHYPEKHLERSLEWDVLSGAPAIGYASRTNAAAPFSTVTQATRGSRKLTAFCELARKHEVDRGVVLPLDNVLGVHGSLALAIDGSDRDVLELSAAIDATEIRALHARLQARHAAAFTRGMLPTLTSRKRQVLRALAAGQTTTEMADTLGVSVFTVDKHVADLKRSLRARTAAQLAALAVQYALLEDVESSQGKSTSRL